MTESKCFKTYQEQIKILILLNTIDVNLIILTIYLTFKQNYNISYKKSSKYERSDIMSLFTTDDTKLDTVFKNMMPEPMQKNSCR